MARHVQRALHANTLDSLGRLYDNTSGTLSLINFLQTLKASSGYFTAQAFRERLEGNRYVDDLALRARTLNQRALEIDMADVHECNPQVKRLLEIRNKRIAHRAGNLVRLAKLSSLVGLSVQDIDALLDRATMITTKYSSLYNASCISSILVGADDFKFLLELVKTGVDQKRAQRYQPDLISNSASILPITAVSG